MLRRLMKSIAKKILPAQMRGWMRLMRVRYSEIPPFRCVDFGSFRRTKPIHSGFSMGRGTYIDRYYIERFLRENSGSIKGCVMELADNEYTVNFGGVDVTQSEVLDIRPNHRTATIIADLSTGIGIQSNAYDCVILTQTLNFIYDVRGAVHTLHRILKPGGTALVSVSGISQISQDEMAYCGDYWRFTSLSLARLFHEVFPTDCVSVESRGNVLSAMAFLHGLAAEELTTQELDQRDLNYQVTVLLKAVKPLK
jgi:hypothetical protein